MIFYNNICYIFVFNYLVVGFKFKYPHFHVYRSSAVYRFILLR